MDAGQLRRNRRVAVSTLAVGLFLLTLASVAWACTAQPVLGPPGNSPAGSGLNPNFGPPDLFPVKVEGSAFQQGPVSIRWNSIDGPELATASGPNFSVQIRIPADAEPGVFYVVAFQRDALGNVSSMARAPFEVTPVEREPVAGSAAGGASGATGTSSTGGATSLSTEGGEEVEFQERPATTRAAAPTRQPALSSAQSGAVSGASAGATAPASQSSPASEAAATKPEAGSAVSAPSSRTITEDLWSAFEKNRLRPSLPDVAPEEPLATGLIAGAALLGIGMLGLLGGFGVAELHRRKTTRSPSSSSF